MKKWLCVCVCGLLLTACSEGEDSQRPANNNNGSQQGNEQQGNEQQGNENGQNSQNGQNGENNGQNSGNNEENQELECGGADYMNDARNCGSCGNNCGYGTCQSGVCVCDQDALDCNRDGRCETRGSACDCEYGTTRKCSSYTDDIDNIKGNCKAGTQRCDGLGWGSCEGEVLPDYQSYLCDAGSIEDRDCDGTPDSIQDTDGDSFKMCGPDGVRDCCDNMFACGTNKPDLVRPDQIYDCNDNNIDDNCDGIVDDGPKSCSEEGAQITDPDFCKITERECSSESDYVWNISNSSDADKTNAAKALYKAMDMCLPYGVKGTNPGIIKVEVTRSNSRKTAVDKRQLNVMSGMKDKNGQVRIAPHGGNTFAVLSTGYASDANHISDGQMLAVSDESDEIPALYSRVHNNILQSHSACLNSNVIKDSVHLHIQMRAPSNVKGFSFDFRFFTQEYPQFICSEYNDFFLALLTDENGDPIAPDVSPDGNISFDDSPNHNPISVNNAFFTTCANIPCSFNQGEFRDCSPMYTCISGKNTCNDTCDKKKEADLMAFQSAPYNGANDKKMGGGTAWLTTQAPVRPGEVFNLDFYIWDTKDNNLDSTVILDNFQWRCDETTVHTDFAEGNAS